MTRIVVLTGAGVSAESGLGTFRDKDGLWTKFDLSEVATPEGFERNPEKVHDFYNARRRNCLEAEPNAAHDALARLSREPDVTLVTQNVDDLHERAGAVDVVHMHGELLRARCTHCRAKWDVTQDMSPHDACPICGAQATRPDIVWFGEIPMYMDRIEESLQIADLFVAIGTSGEVYPAAGFVSQARSMRVETLELNLEATSRSGVFDDSRFGPATEIVPQWVSDIIGPG